MDPNIQNPQSNIPATPSVGPDLTQTINQAPVQPQVATQPLVSATQQIQQQPVNQPSNNLQNPHGKLPFLKVLLVLIIVIGLTAGIIYAGYIFMGVNSQKEVKNATMATEEQKPITVSPAVMQDRINPNDKTDQAITSDTKILDKNMTELDSALNNVNESVNDKQENLQ